MLYDEFVQGTGCREIDYNYSVYKDVEQIYMNSNITKEEAYAIGKMRVNNSLTEAEEREVTELKEALEDALTRSEAIEDYYYCGTYRTIQEQHKGHVKELQELSREIKYYREQIKNIQSRAK